MKYATKYSTKTQFSSDLNNLNNLDDIWVAYVEEESKSYIKRMRPSRIKYKVESAGEYTLVNGSSVIAAPTYIEEAYLIEGEQKTKLEISIGKPIKANLKPGINEVDFIFKPYADAILSNAFNGTPIYELPENCFDNFNRISNASNIFKNCTELKNIPIDVFKLLNNLSSATGCFYGCTSLEYLPGDIFYNCTNMRDVRDCFSGCSSLKEIPSDLFSKCPNINNMANCFKGCTSLTGSTPKYWNIFDSAMGSNCFYDCTGLTEYKEYRIPTSWGLVYPDTYLVYDISNSSGTYSEIKLVNLFNNISSITILNDPNRTSEIRPGSSLTNQRWYTPTSPENPTELYVKIEIRQDITETSSLFGQCTALKSIPEDLFDNCTDLTKANSTFTRCTALTSIPEKLFSKCGDKLTDVQGCFSTCTGLTELPQLLFNDNSKISNFNTCFYNCSNLTGDAPYFDSSEPIYYWTREQYSGGGIVYPANITGNDCFYNCRKLTQYNSMPAGWK